MRTKLHSAWYLAARFIPMLAVLVASPAVGTSLLFASPAPHTAEVADQLLAR